MIFVGFIINDSKFYDVGIKFEKWDIFKDLKIIYITG